jgi:succinate dehydrogenase hydrophobic anchor subunit
MNIKKSHLLSWLGQRTTAIIIAVFLPIHIIAIPFADKKISYSLVSERLSHSEWLIIDIFLLIACIYHGLNGLYSITIDFNPDKRILKGILFFLYLFGIMLTIYGILVLWRFVR